jgi:hypothetical protein
MKGQQEPDCTSETRLLAGEYRMVVPGSGILCRAGRFDNNYTLIFKIIAINGRERCSYSGDVDGCGTELPP